MRSYVKAYVKAKGPVPKGKQVDHKDRNHKNEKASNLRLASPQENLRNRGKFNNGGKSKLKGAYFDSNKKKWIGQIRIDGKLNYLGQFDSEAKAHAAWTKAAKPIHKQFFAKR